jgi:hypothetical protein
MLRNGFAGQVGRSLARSQLQQSESLRRRRAVTQLLVHDEDRENLSQY